MADEKDSTPAEVPNGNAPAAQDEKHENGVGANHEQPPKPPQKTDTGGSKKKGPEGGFDDTPIPRAPPGYTVKFTTAPTTCRSPTSTPSPPIPSSWPSSPRICRRGTTKILR
jgi:hypothetical protein